MRRYEGGWTRSWCIHDAEEAKRPLTKQRSCLMESEGSDGEEAARARRGPLFTDENLSMGG